MAAIACEQQRFLEELDILKKKAKCLQQEVECLELERANCATEDERLQSQRKLECYEQRMRELERCLQEKCRQVEEAKECYRSLRQELHQFNLRLDCTKKRRREKKDCATNDVDGDYGNRDNYTKTTKQSNSAANQATVVTSASGVKASPSGAASKTKTSDKEQPSSSPSQQQQQQQQKETGANDKTSSSIAPAELHDPSETSPDCIDAPPGINQEPPDSSTPVRICEVSLKGKYIRLVNASSEEKDVGGHFIVQRKQDGPTTVFQFPASVPLPGKATVTVWSAASGSNRNSPPTDFVFSAQQEWLTGTDCTTVLCKPNQQAMSWLTSDSSSTVGPICAGLRPNDANQESRSQSKVKEEQQEGRKNGNEGEGKEEKTEGRKKATEEDEKDKKRAKITEDRSGGNSGRDRSGGSPGKDRSGGNEKHQKKRSKSRSRSRSTSRSRKSKIKSKKKTTTKRSRQRSEDCEEKVDDCQQEMDSSSDDCKGGRMCEEEEEDECVEEEEEDCWWGEKRCSLDKTIPCASVHLGDDTQTKTKGQRSKVSECYSNGVNECASSASSDCYEPPPPPQKQTKQTDDCEGVRVPPRKGRSKKATIETNCPPPPGRTKEKSDDCRSRGIGGMRSGKTKASGRCSGGQRKRLKDGFGCCSNSSQELRTRNKNKSCNDENDEFYICPCDLDECKGQGAGQGWLGSWSSWFSRRCSEEKRNKAQENADPCVDRSSEDKKRNCRFERDTGGCCEDKKVSRGGGCEEKKAPSGGCCEEKKVSRGGCCEDKKVSRGGCCEEKKAPRGGCCKEKKVSRGGCCEEKKVSRGGCCEEKKVSRGGCCEEKVTRRKRRSSDPCEEKEEECIDSCQQISRIESDCGALSSRSNPQLGSGIEGGRRAGGVRGLRGVSLGGGMDEFGCPCACRQSDSFSVTTASLMAAGLTVAAMYCA